MGSVACHTRWRWCRQWRGGPSRFRGPRRLVFHPDNVTKLTTNTLFKSPSHSVAYRTALTLIAPLGQLLLLPIASTNTNTKKFWSIHSTFLHIPTQCMPKKFTWHWRVIVCFDESLSEKIVVWGYLHCTDMTHSQLICFCFCVSLSCACWISVSFWWLSRLVIDIHTKVENDTALICFFHFGGKVRSIFCISN